MNNQNPLEENAIQQDAEHQKRINRIKTAINTYMRKEHGVKSKAGLYYESMGNTENERDPKPDK